MKFVLGFMVCCFLVIVGTVLFAPEDAHEIIDKFHESSSHATKPEVPESNNENSNDRTDKDETIVTASDPVEAAPISITVVSTQPFPPRNEQEMLEWLHAHNYTVAAGSGFYIISWQKRKRTYSKPTGFLRNSDGAIVPQYGDKVTINGNNSINFFSSGEMIISNNGIDISVNSEYKNGSWWIVTTQSFVWTSDHDNINEVLSKAKKIKGE